MALLHPQIPVAYSTERPPIPYSAECHCTTLVGCGKEPARAGAGWNWQEAHHRARAHTRIYRD